MVIKQTVHGSMNGICQIAQIAKKYFLSFGQGQDFYYNSDLLSLMPVQQPDSSAVKLSFKMLAQACRFTTMFFCSKFSKKCLQIKIRNEHICEQNLCKIPLQKIFKTIISHVYFTFELGHCSKCVNKKFTLCAVCIFSIRVSNKTIEFEYIKVAKQYSLCLVFFIGMFSIRNINSVVRAF